MTIIAPKTSAWDCSDRAVVHRLYERVGRAVIHRVRRVVRREDVAQEILQESFVRLWSSGPRFESEGAAFTWVFRTSHRLALDHLRARFSHSDFVSAEELEALSTAASTQEAEAFQAQVLRKLVGRLSEEEASVFVFKVVDRMTLDEIADAVGVSSKTVSRVLARVEQKLAKFRGALHHVD